MPSNVEINMELRRFLKEQTRPILPAAAAQQLGTTQSRLLADIDQMIALGYHVEMHPYLGIRLYDIPDRLMDFEISDGLNSKILAQRIFTYKTCASTSDEAWAAVNAGEAKEGDIFIADHQSSGRGRMGRSWSAPEGVGLYFSFVGELKIPQDKLPFVSASMALAIANAIEQFVHLPTEIKWPNDVLIGGRKVAGILVETRSNHPGIFVIGVGLNVNQSESDFPENLRGFATSLKLERKRDRLHRVRLLRPLLFYLDSVYGQLRKRKFDRIAKAWKEFIHLEGRKVSVKVPGEEHVGTMISVDLNDGVKILEDNGDERHFPSARVSSIAALSLASDEAEDSDDELEDSGDEPE